MFGGGDGGIDFSGGGFMPTQPSNAFDPGTKKSGTPSSGLFSLTVKQLSRATQNSTDDSLLFEGKEISNVTLVGMLSSKEERMTDISFMLDDGTGRVEVKRWIESPDAPEAIQLHNMPHGEYIRVHGHLRTFQNKKTIVAFSVRPITDFNEVTFHFLECIAVHMLHSKSEGARQHDPSFVPPVNAPAATPYRASSYNQGGGGVNQYPAPAAAPIAATNTSGMDQCHRRVQAVFEDPASLRIEQGLHFEEVVRKCTGLTKQQVRSAIDYLVNEGYIYSTIDDDHFKSTSA